MKRKGPFQCLLLLLVCLLYVIYLSIGMDPRIPRVVLSSVVYQLQSSNPAGVSGDLDGRHSESESLKLRCRFAPAPSSPPRTSTTRSTTPRSMAATEAPRGVFRRFRFRRRFPPWGGGTVFVRMAGRVTNPKHANRFAGQPDFAGELQWLTHVETLPGPSSWVLLDTACASYV